MSMVDMEHFGELSRSLMGPHGESLYDVLSAKSSKKNKKTGVSPWDTALKSAANRAKTAQETLYNRTMREQQAAVDKATKDAKDAADKAAKQHEYDISHPEAAQKAQDEQWKALVEGLKTSWAKGTLTQKYGGTLPDWRDEAALRDVFPGAGGLQGLTSDQIREVTGRDVYPLAGLTGPQRQEVTTREDYPLAGLSPEERQQVMAPPVGAGEAAGPTTTQPPTEPGAQPSSPPLDLTTPVGQATLKVATLQQQIQQQKDVIAAVHKASTNQGGGPFDAFSPGDWVDLAARSGHDLMSVVGTGLNWMNKPFAYTGAALDKIINDVKAGDWQSALAGTDALQAGWNAAAHDEGLVSGSQILQDLGMPDIPVVTPLLGAGAEVALDPTTYISFGIAPAVKDALGIGIRSQIDIDRSLLQQAGKLAGKKGLTTGIGLAIPKKAKGVVNDISHVVQAGGAVGTNMTKYQSLAHDIMTREISRGTDVPTAEAYARVAIEKQMLSDQANQKLATLRRNAAIDGRNQPIIDVRLLGKSTGLGKLPIINAPYQAVRKGKAALSNTEAGQAIRSAFDLNYWLPGDTQTLWNKAQTRGVHSLEQEKQRINDVFKGLTTAEKRRIADETELGRDLSGEISKNGKDLGDIQKFWQQSNAEKFAEHVTDTGKYTPGQEVKNYVFHYYQRGSKNEIDKVRTARRLRLRDGATGADRVTLQQAEDRGLKPIREADRIMLAHAADHTRQMTNEAFQRMVVEHYGIPTDNHIWAHENELEKIKPPKSAAIKPGISIYAQPDVARVYNAIGRFGSRNEEEVAKFMKYIDSVTRYWKMANTSMRPGHHINNFIGDVFMNFLDGVTNPYRYLQGLKMVSGDRSQLSLRVGQQTLNGDDLYDLIGKSGMMKGFIGTELMEGRNPIIKGVNEFSQRRELFARYAHFFDALKKEGDKVNLGPNNTVGLMKAATAAAKRVNKWNINYGALTPVERDYFRRAMPFYSWSRKALPLMIEAMATRPGRITAISKLNRFISNVAGVDPFDMQGIPVQDWVKDQGYARVSNGPEPNIWSIPWPGSQLPASWLGSGNITGKGGLAEKFATSLHPAIQLPFELAQMKNLFTGAPLDTSIGGFSQDLFGIIKDAMAASKIGQSEADTIRGINRLTNIGIMKDTENSQLSALHNEQAPLSHEIAQFNKTLKAANLEVNKTKYGYRVYNTHYKQAVKDFSTQADAMIYALALASKGKQ